MVSGAGIETDACCAIIRSLYSRYLTHVGEACRYRMEDLHVEPWRMSEQERSSDDWG